MKIGVLTGGGDCPGLNAAIRAIVMYARNFGYQIVGIRDGWRGLIKENYCDLKQEDVEEIMSKGGTILGTSRTNPYKDPSEKEKVIENIKKEGFDCIIAIGGEDTLTVAYKLSKEGIKVVGVPKTMDNDLSETDYTFGFDSAVSVAVDAIEKLKDTAKSHSRVMVLEVMGRNAGWVALFAGLAGAADYILIPEMEVDFQRLAETLKEKRRKGKNYAVVVVSEGIDVGREAQTTDEFGHKILKEKGIGEFVAKKIKELTGFEVRSCAIGHIQRGGSPTLFDRILATRLGIKAVQMVCDGSFGKMAALSGNQIVEVSLEDAVGRPKKVDDYWKNLINILCKT